MLARVKLLCVILLVRYSRTYHHPYVAIHCANTKCSPIDRDAGHGERAGPGQGGHQAETRTARYTVDYTQEKELWSAVEEGRRALMDWLHFASFNYP